VSYSLYLVHSIVGVILFNALRRWQGGSEAGIFAIVAAATAASLAAAEVLYRTCEAPAVRLSKRIRVRPAPRSP